jgi:hypothetical protein
MLLPKLHKYFAPLYWAEDKVLLRHADMQKKKELNPHRLPVIIKSLERSLILHKEKFLVGTNMDMKDILSLVRKKSVLHASESIFLFVNGDSIPCMTSNMLTLYNQYKQADDILYFFVTKENTFG